MGATSMSDLFQMLTSPKVYDRHSKAVCVKKGAYNFYYYFP